MPDPTTLQRNCACVRLDARDCIRARYRTIRPFCDDCDDIEDDDERCECACHDEMRDVLGGDDDDY